MGDPDLVIDCERLTRSFPSGVALDALTARLGPRSFEDSEMVTHVACLLFRRINQTQAMA